jgi:hypothetical protein
MPVLDRTVAPRAVDDPNRSEIKHLTEVIGINPRLMAQDPLPEVFLLLWCELIVGRATAVLTVHALSLPGSRDTVRTLPYVHPL